VPRRTETAPAPGTRTQAHTPTPTDSEDVSGFDGAIAEETLESYLSRAVTHAGLLAADEPGTGQNLDEHLRMLGDIGAKFVGRAAYRWWGAGHGGYSGTHWEHVDERASRVHEELGGEVILQACLFETVHEHVGERAVPDWVFEAFDRQPEDRTFDYEAMLYDSGLHVDRWADGLSVPDMSETETRMWFYDRGRRYIDAGIEALHLGQVHLMDGNDPDHEHWFDLVGKLREYAAENARRGIVLADAHTFGVTRGDELLFDFHSFPCRVQELLDDAELDRHDERFDGDVRSDDVLPGGLDEEGGIFGRSAGGTTPSGWSTESLPYLVEVDNFGISDAPGEPTDGHFVWGYDEICWFARQPEWYRDGWLAYAHDWVAENTASGQFQMPTNRTIYPAPVDVTYEDETYTANRYRANAPSSAMPTGFGQEETIAEVWSEALGPRA